MSAMSGFESYRPPVAGAGGTNRQAPQGADDHVLIRIKMEIEAEEPTKISTDDLVDAIAYAIKDTIRGLGIYADDSETCETSSNVYFKSLDAEWKRVDFCLGQVDRRHLHVSADVGYTLNRRAIKAEIKFEEVSG
jgi:hypothetical protein